MATITLPAYAADTLGESVTFEAPAEWHERIGALAPRLPYGPNHSRSVLSTLLDMSRQCRAGYTALAYDTLQAAERIAAR